MRFVCSHIPFSPGSLQTLSSTCNCVPTHVLGGEEVCGKPKKTIFWDQNSNRSNFWCRWIPSGFRNTSTFGKGQVEFWFMRDWCKTYQGARCVMQRSLWLLGKPKGCPDEGLKNPYSTLVQHFFLKKAIAFLELFPFREFLAVETVTQQQCVLTVVSYTREGFERSLRMEISFGRIKLWISFVGFSKSSLEFSKELELLHVPTENQEVRKSLHSIV